MSEERRIQEILSKRLKEAREYRGFSQEEVARYLGVPRSEISLIESQSRRVSTAKASRLAELYQTSMESLTTQAETAPERCPLLARAVDGLSKTDRDEILRFAQFLRETRTK